jgi:hypothetical protein
MAAISCLTLWNTPRRIRLSLGQFADSKRILVGRGLADAESDFWGAEQDIGDGDAIRQKTGGDGGLPLPDAVELSFGILFDLPGFSLVGGLQGLDVRLALPLDCQGVTVAPLPHKCDDGDDLPPRLQAVNPFAEWVADGWRKGGAWVSQGSIQRQTTHAKSDASRLFVMSYRMEPTRVERATSCMPCKRSPN